MKYLFLLLLSSNFCAWSKNIPTEWELLLSCLNDKQENISPENLSSLRLGLSNMNIALNFIPEDRIMPTLKVLLYRYVLEETPTSFSNKFPPRDIENFFSQYQQTLHKSHCQFTTWLVQSMEADYLAIKSQGGFNNLKNSGSYSAVEAKGLSNLKYLSNWVFFLKSSGDQSTSLLNYYAQMLFVLSQRLNLFANYSVERPIKKNYMEWTNKNFSLNEIKNSVPTAEKTETTSAAEILEKNIPTIDQSPNPVDRSTAIDDLIQKEK